MSIYVEGVSAEELNRFMQRWGLDTAEVSRRWRIARRTVQSWRAGRNPAPGLVRALIELEEGRMKPLRDTREPNDDDGKDEEARAA